MQPWRRKLLFGVADHPFRAMAIVVGICLVPALWIGRSIVQGDPTPVVLPPERAWQQPLVDALGSDGYVYFWSSVVGALFGIAIWLKLWLRARIVARAIRNYEGAAAALAQGHPG